jgi:hypothetical protein
MKQIEEATKGKVFYGMLKWANTRGQFRSPALRKHDGTLATSTADKLHLLRETHLPTDRASEDLPPLSFLSAIRTGLM